MKNLVIVESPTKAKTLSRFLGSGYQIVASMGHVRDLPRGEFGVDVKDNFTPKYVIPKEKIKMVNALAKQGAEAEKLWLATDPDREGEAIAWNLLQVIREKGKVKNPVYKRVVFHEITESAVKESFDHPREIDQDLVRAQQARRVLDRLVGYKLSPLLWKKVKSRLSAGRVQSVALKLIVDREREIEAFKSAEYWLIDLTLESQRAREPEIFRAINEAAVKSYFRMSELEILIDDGRFLKVLGDGVIIATQTGSTAYSLSAGGPIVDSGLDSLLVTPINPIGLPIPSVVLSPQKKISIKVIKGNDVSLIIDGQEHIKITQDQSVKVGMGRYKVKFGYFDKDHLFRALNAKFGLEGRSGDSGMVG